MKDFRTPEARKWASDFIPPETCPAIDFVQNGLEYVRDANSQLRHAAHYWRKAAIVQAREIDRLNALLNAPELHDFAKGVVLEAAHQRERWGAEHDAGKEPLDWFWLIGFLAQKAAMAALAGDTDKAKHHCISTAAAMANWFANLLGADTSMRPGIAPPDAERGSGGGA